MQPVMSFRDLEVWQLGMDQVVAVYRRTDGLPSAERFGLTSQIRRAAVSVPSNIAEGHARRSDGAYLKLGIGGAFGLVAYLAESQRKEFGVRVALGASMAHIVRRSLAAALLPVAAGVACGLFAAALVSRLFTSLHAGISALDGVTYAAVAVMTLGCTAIAALAAAWRLRRTNPADALRAS